MKKRFGRRLLRFVLALRTPRGQQVVLQVTVEVVEDVGPAIALVLHEALQEAQGGRLAVGARVLDRAGERRRVLETRLLGQVASDLEVGVTPFWRRR